MAAPRQALTLRRVAGGKGSLIFGLICGLLAALCIGIGAVNLRDLHRSLDWPHTSGAVVHAEVEEHITVHRDKDGHRTSTSVSHESNVAYVYRVGGREYRGQRVRFAWEMSRSEAEATVARYPVGRSVDVFYDPRDPGKSVLEPGGDASVYATLIGLGVFFIAVAAAYFAVRASVLHLLPGFRLRIDRDMARRVSEAKGWRAKWAACNWIQKTALGIAVPVLGLAFIGWMALGAYLFYQGVDGYLHPDGAQSWPATSGLVVASEMKPILVRRSDDTGRAATFRRYDLHIVVEYRVLGTRYAWSENPSVPADDALAREVLARFQKGRYVNVYYKAGNPGEAGLTPHEPAGLGVAVFGAIMMAPWLLVGSVFGLLWIKRRYLSPAQPAGAA
jgi:Protein of unknown function (DUF3592)